MKFSVSGLITLKGGEKKFNKQIEAESNAAAVEKTYALFGSNNRVKRTMVKIEKVENTK